MCSSSLIIRKLFITTMWSLVAKSKHFCFVKDMIPSVQERKKNVHVFMNFYPYLCRLQNTIPNPNIKVDNSNKSLDFVGDRLKFDDWKPVLEAISNDRTLHFISVRSRHLNAKVLEETETETQVRQNTPKSCPLFTSYILTKLTEALSKCLSNSPALTALVLEKIPLRTSALMQLTQGLEVTQNLQQLSLAYTQIGDDECAGLCHVLRNRLSLVWLNLTGCGLTDKGVGMLCNLLKFQKLNRYGESWKQSLRCRPVNPNVMPGLRRLTLNFNPIGDAGVKIFAESLLDDLWLKALDLQHCDVTMVGAEALLSLVTENHFLSVVDVRGNLQVPNSLVAAIVQQLAENSGDSIPEFQWLKEDTKSSKSSCRSVPGTSTSRSTQRLLSSTTLSSSNRGRSVCVLPSKIRFAHPVPTAVRTRSASAKRTNPEKNTPHLPWNWNNPELKRGNSDQVLRRHSSYTNQDILSELQAVKKQLQEVSAQLDEEKRRRVKIENELEKYKNVLDLPDDSACFNKPMLQSLFCQMYKAHIQKEKEDLPEPENNEIDQKFESVTMKKHDSLESVIRTINGENHPDMKLKESNSPTNGLSNGKSNSEDAPSRAQLIFQSLISS